MLGIARLGLGDPTAARAALEEGLPVSIAAGDRWAIPLGLAGFAGLAARTGQARLALRLAGAAEAYRESYQFSAPRWIEDNLDRWLAPCRATAGAAAARILAQGTHWAAPREALVRLLAPPESRRWRLWGHAPRLRRRL